MRLSREVPGRTLVGVSLVLLLTFSWGRSVGRADEPEFRLFDGFDDKIVSMYARGMTTREIRAHLEEMYGVDVSPDLISRVTDAVVEEMTARLKELGPLNWKERSAEYCGAV